MDLQACTETLRARVGQSSGLDATLKFDCGEDGVVHIDGLTLPNVVGNEDKAADCTVHVSLQDLSALVAGELDPTTGFMTGKLRVSGDMSVALKMQRIL
jgi:putative sterol carrier protein